MSRPPAPVAIRFWEKVAIGPVVRPELGPCWVWTGFVNPNGYGRFHDGRKTDNAHRVGFVIQIGPVPPGKSVLHRCDNPPCIRGFHLYPGSQRQNVRDREARRRPASDPIILARLAEYGRG